jgi:hypothetical protein
VLEEKYFLVEENKPHTFDIIDISTAVAAIDGSLIYYLTFDISRVYF